MREYALAQGQYRSFVLDVYEVEPDLIQLVWVPENKEITIQRIWEKKNERNWTTEINRKPTVHEIFWRPVIIEERRIEVASADGMIVYFDITIEGANDTKLYLGAPNIIELVATYALPGRVPPSITTRCGYTRTPYAGESIQITDLVNLKDTTQTFLEHARLAPSYVYGRVTRRETFSQDGYTTRFVITPIKPLCRWALAVDLTRVAATIAEMLGYQPQDLDGFFLFSTIDPDNFLCANNVQDELETMIGSVGTIQAAITVKLLEYIATRNKRRYADFCYELKARTGFILPLPTEQGGVEISFKPHAGDEIKLEWVKTSESPADRASRVREEQILTNKAFLALLKPETLDKSPVAVVEYVGVTLGLVEQLVRRNIRADHDLFLHYDTIERFVHFLSPSLGLTDDQAQWVKRLFARLILADQTYQYQKELELKLTVGEGNPSNGTGPTNELIAEQTAIEWKNPEKTLKSSISMDGMDLSKIDINLPHFVNPTPWKRHIAKSMKKLFEEVNTEDSQWGAQQSANHEKCKKEADKLMTWLKKIGGDNVILQNLTKTRKKNQIPQRILDEFMALVNTSLQRYSHQWLAACNGTIQNLDKWCELNSTKTTKITVTTMDAIDIAVYLRDQRIKGSTVAKNELARITFIASRLGWKVH